MAYLIDGHNLIPKVSGLSLSDLEDEQALVDRLRGFARQHRKHLEVYFDRAAPGHAGKWVKGFIVVHFVPSGTTADDAIRRRLETLGKAVRNWTVVSDDRQVQREAEAHHARLISSTEFARLLAETPDEPGGDQRETSKDLDEWLELFESKHNSDNLE